MTQTDATQLSQKLIQLRTMLGHLSLASVKVDTPFLDKKAMMTHFEAIDEMLKIASPDLVCPYCNGSGCRACKDIGFISKILAKMQPKEFDAS